MSDTTYHGYLVTLQTTLDVMDFVSDKCGFQHLMTTRLNQDALEVKLCTKKSAIKKAHIYNDVIQLLYLKILSGIFWNDSISLWIH